MAEQPTARMIAEQKAKKAKESRKPSSTMYSNIENVFKGFQADRVNEASKLVKDAELAYKTKHDELAKQMGVSEVDYRSNPELFELAKKQRSAYDMIEKVNSSPESQREKDILKGAKFGQAVLGEDGLSRLSEDVDVQEVLQRYKNVSEKGLDSGELAMKKSDLYNQIDASGETARRNLQAALAKSGVKGGAAGKQIASTLMDTASKKADVSRDLFLTSAEAQRQGLADYSNRLGQVKTFDLSQEADEKNLILQAGFGTAQIGSSERAAKYAAEQARLAADAKASAAPSCFRAGTRIGGKPIETLKIGDIIGNDMVTGVFTLKQNEPFYKYGDVLVTGSHYIYHDEEWKRVRDIPSAINTGLNDGVCYSLRTLTGTIMIGDELFGDYDGISDEETENFIIEKMNGEKLN